MFEGKCFLFESLLAFRRICCHIVSVGVWLKIVGRIVAKMLHKILVVQ